MSWKFFAIWAIALAAGIFTAVQLAPPSSNLVKDRQATGALFTEGRFFCSGVEIGSYQGDGLFLTARHCATDLETNEVRPHVMVQFSDNQAGPYYRIEPIFISLDEDMAILRIKNGGNIPFVTLEDDRTLREGAPIYNISYPLGMGKLKFDGEYMSSEFSFLPLDLLQEFPVWKYSMPVNLTFAPGSSGSGVYDSKTGDLIGLAVGTTGESNFNIVMPSHRIMYFMQDLKDNTVDKFVVANPPKVPSFNLFEFVQHLVHPV